jgi:hypothetical protein
MAKPNEYHLRIGKLLLRYLRGTVSLGIVYRPISSGLNYTIWTDAIWGIEDDRKSF